MERAGKGRDYTLTLILLPDDREGVFLSVIESGLFQAEGVERGVLPGETEGDVLAVKFCEAGFREAGDQLAIIAILTDVCEDQILHIRSEEFLQSLHRIGVAEVADPACDAPYGRRPAFGMAEHDRIVVGLQHEEFASAESGFHEIGNEPEVGREADLVPVNGKGVSDRVHVVRDFEWGDLNPAEFELESRLEEDEVRRDLDLAFSKLRDLFRHEVDGDLKSFGQCGTTALMHMVRVSVRDQNGADGSRIDADFGQSALNLDPAEPGIEEQIATGTMDNGGVAAAAAAEDGAAECGKLSRRCGHIDYGRNEG